jgi:hypothetical protein
MKKSVKPHNNGMCTTRPLGPPAPEVITVHQEPIHYERLAWHHYNHDELRLIIAKQRYDEIQGARIALNEAVTALQTFIDRNPDPERDRLRKVREDASNHLMELMQPRDEYSPDVERGISSLMRDLFNPNPPSAQVDNDNH